MKETIRDFYGRIIGFITTQPNGDKLAQDFYGKILGKYDAKLKLTRDFYGKIMSKGDTTSALVWKAYYDNQQQQLNQNKK